MARAPQYLQALGFTALVALLACSGCAAPPAATAPGGVTPAARATVDGPAAAVPPTAPALERVKISTAGQSMTTMPIQIANLKGFFVAEGVEVEMVYADNTIGVAALQAGDVDFMTQADTAILGYFQGLPLRAIAWTAVRPPYVVVAQPAVRTPADLAGKTLGVSQIGTTPYLAIMGALRAQGIDPTQVTYRNAGSDSGRLTSLTSGQVDAAFFAPPVHVKALGEGRHVLFIASDYLEYLVSGLATHERTLRERPAMVKSLLRGLLKSIHWLKANRAETIELEMAFQDLDQESVAAAYDILVKIFPDNGEASEEAMQRQTDLQRELANVSRPASWMEATDLTLLREVQRELGLR
ncbi:MAG TPA: ABC transporter substrate-binding protein [Chloroflexota bacterium]|nr:ABC transporter substrate-binding protein [Chloroflexota bacterium]